MTNRPATIPNPLANLAALGAPPANAAPTGIGQYITAAMLSAAGGGCTCETCRLMAKAAKSMRAGLLEEDDDA